MTAQSAGTDEMTGFRRFLPHALLFLYYGSGAWWNPFFSVFLQDQGLRGVEIGLIMALRPIVSLVAQPLGGVVGDVWGRTRTLQLALIAAAFMTAGYSFGHSFFYLAVWTGLTALVSNPVGPLLDSAALDYIDQRGKGAFGHLRLWGAVGWASCAFLSGTLIADQNIRWTFLAGAGSLIVAWLLATRLPKLHGQTGGQARRDWRGALDLLKNRELRNFFMIVVLMQAGAGSIFSFYPLYLETIGATKGLIGTAYTFQGLGELPLYVGAAWIISRWGSTKTIIFSFCIFAVRALLYSVVSTPWIGASVEWMHGLSFSLFLVASVGFVNERVPSQWRATGQSLFSVSYFGLGSIIASLLAGYLYDVLGVQRMFLVNGLWVLAVAVTAWKLLPKDQMRRKQKTP